MADLYLEMALTLSGAPDAFRAEAASPLKMLSRLVYS